MKYDVIVVGGSYAGMSAALQLLRARCQVLIIDGGQRRNRFADHSHGFLGQDGVDPAELAGVARRQLEAYPTLTWVDGSVTEAGGKKDDFSVTLKSGDVHHARRILLATGVADKLPNVAGIENRWGKSVFHCPYCHGYELDRGHIGVIATGPMSLHQAQLLSEWGTVTFLINDALHLEATQKDDLTGRGITLEDKRITGLAGHADVLLEDDRTLAFAGLFTSSIVRPATPLAKVMGCDLIETPIGERISTNEMKETTVSGVFACGDSAQNAHSVALAVGDGAFAGAMTHRSLVWPNM